MCRHSNELSAEPTDQRTNQPANQKASLVIYPYTCTADQRGLQTFTILRGGRPSVRLLACCVRKLHAAVRPLVVHLYLLLEIFTPAARNSAKFKTATYNLVICHTSVVLYT